MWKYPWFLNYKCEHEKHAVDNCLRQDYKIRMMVIKKNKYDWWIGWLVDRLVVWFIDWCLQEWERERRLRIREKKIAAAAAAEEIDD